MEDNTKISKIIIELKIFPFHWSDGGQWSLFKQVGHGLYKLQRAVQERMAQDPSLLPTAATPAPLSPWQSLFQQLLLWQFCRF